MKANETHRMEATALHAQSLENTAEALAAAEERGYERGLRQAVKPSECIGCAVRDGRLAVLDGYVEFLKERLAQYAKHWRAT